MYHIVMFVYQTCKRGTCLLFLVILTIVKNEKVATEIQNVILNNSEEYYNIYVIKKKCRTET